MDKLILFLRDLARQKYESFVVFKDAAYLDASNLNVSPSDIARGHYWDKQFFIEGNSDLNKLSAGFPLLGVERDVRTLTTDSETLDKLWVVLAITKESDQSNYEDGTKRFLYDEMTKIALTLQEIDLITYNGSEHLLHPSQYQSLVGARVKQFKPLVQDEPLEIFPTDVGNNAISAVSIALNVKSCVTGFGSLTAMQPLSTDILANASCC